MFRKAAHFITARRGCNPDKKDGFAVGVSPDHYEFIESIARAKDIPRTQVLEDILSFYIMRCAKEHLL